MTDHQTFDQYAEDYDLALAAGLSVSGESKDYFAFGRLAWLSGCLRRLQVQPGSVMDFGCGTGSSVPFLLDLIGVETILGIDPSLKSLDVAKRMHGSDSIQFLLSDQYQPSEQIDLAFCNGVFHHIPLSERAAACNYIYRSLRPNGLFALWENNPWNPGTRYVMSRLPFDRDAITLSALEAQQMVRAAGFEVLRTDFLFLFPNSLRSLRWIEPHVSRLPFGAQYQVLCSKR